MKIKHIDLYTDYLISTTGYAPATGLPAILDGDVSHDQVTRFLSERKYTSKGLWREVKPAVRGRLKGFDKEVLFGTAGLYEQGRQHGHVESGLAISLAAAAIHAKQSRVHVHLRHLQAGMLKIKHKANHFALQAKLYIKATQQAYAELQKLSAA